MNTVVQIPVTGLINLTRLDNGLRLQVEFAASY